MKCQRITKELVGDAAPESTLIPSRCRMVDYADTILHQHASQFTDVLRSIVGRDVNKYIERPHVIHRSIAQKGKISTVVPVVLTMGMT